MLTPFVRNQGLIKQSRANRIVCLTTHYMDEADELGDRVCIMVHGKAACSGTNGFLKRAMGCGYSLNFVKLREDVKDDPIRDLVRQHCGADVSEASVVGRELRLRVPFSGSSAFPPLMRELDQRLEALGLESYGVGVADLEDVFLKVASGGTLAARPDSAARPGPHGLPAPGGPGGVEASRPRALEARAAPAPGRQFLGLLQRRTRHGFRDSRAFCCQILLPGLIMLLFMLITSDVFSSRLSLRFDPILLALGSVDAIGKPFPTSVSVSVLPDAGEVLASLGRAWAESPPPGAGSVLLNASLGLNRSLVPAFVPGSARTERLLGQRALQEWAFGLSGGDPQFGGVLYSRDRVTLFANMSVQHSAPAMLNAHYAKLLSSLPQAPRGPGDPQPRPVDGIEVVSRPLEATFHEAGFVNGVSSVSMGMVVMTAYAFIPAGIAAYVAMERETEFKHQLMVSGAGSRPYWLSNLVFDSVFGLFSLLATLGVMAFFDPEAWLSFPSVYGTVALLLLFVPAASASSYFLSFFFQSSGGALVMVLILNLVLGTVGMEMSTLLLLFPNTRT